MALHVARTLTVLVSFCLAVCSLNFASGEQAGERSTHPGENVYALSEVVIDADYDVNALTRLQKRQEPTTPLINNTPSYSDIGAGQVQFWKFSQSELQSPQATGTPVFPGWQGQPKTTPEKQTHQELKRQSQGGIWVSLSICKQPDPSGQQPVGPPPGLALYVSHNDNNQNPGPGSPDFGQQTPAINTIGGQISHYENKAGDSYIGIAAPSIQGFNGGWTYQLTVSNQDYYTSYHDDFRMEVVDTDSNSTFFRTEGLIDPTSSQPDLATSWVNSGGPFGVFVYDENDPMMAGINRSFCGLNTYAVAKGNLQGVSSEGSEARMKLFNKTMPYEQLYISHLNQGTNYMAALALPGTYSLDIGSKTVGGGGSIWKSIDFETRRGDTNCQLIHNLAFCDNVDYAVPSNPGFLSNNNWTGLAAMYDNYTQKELWQNFRNSLDLIPCNTSDDAKYSLARDCDDCAAAYKDWLCAVSIPRCADVSSPAPSLHLRNTQLPATFRNGSNVKDIKNPHLTNELNLVARNNGLGNYLPDTGPYNEVLPCESLCHRLVQSCPSILGFACPGPGRGLEWAYTSPSIGGPSLVDGYPACNDPSTLWLPVSSGMRQSPSFLLLLLGFGLAAWSHA